MKSSEAYAALAELERPVATTADAARVWELKLDAASHLLARLADAGLVRRIRHGLWTIGPGRSDPLEVLPLLTNPYPAYMSYWSALFHHHMIEQVPTMVHAATLERAKKVRTTDDVFDIHRIHAQLFGGFDGATGVRSGVATPEKALFDTVYLLAPRGARIQLPEIELPRRFREKELRSWLDRVPTDRLRSLTAGGLRQVFSVAGKAA